MSSNNSSSSSLYGGPELRTYPPGMMAKYDTDSLRQRGEQQSNVAIAFLVLAWFFIALRMYTRAYVISNFGWDDTTMILAGITFTFYCAAMIFLDANGGGTHITSIAELQSLIKWTVAGQATYIITVMMLKISLGIFFARITIKPWQLWTIYCTVGVNVFSSASSFFYVLLRCGANLDEYVIRQMANKCPSRSVDRFFAYQQASFTTLTDFIFALLPIFILWNASMTIRAKLSVGIILSLAALGCICSLIRFQFVDGLTQIDDFFWNATNIAIWSTIEPGAGIIATCLATLRPLLKKPLVKVQSLRSSTSRRQTDPPGANCSPGELPIRPMQMCYQHDQIVTLHSLGSEAVKSPRSIFSPASSDVPLLLRQSGALMVDKRNLRTENSKTSLRTNSSIARSLDRPLPPLPIHSSTKTDADMV